MINIYPQIFLELEKHMQEFIQSKKCPACLSGKKVKLRPDYDRNSTQFPHVTIAEKGNIFADKELDNQEKHSSLVFDINIYDNSKNRMEICSTLALVVNQYMSETMGFNRVVSEPMPNLLDATIYRVFQRYDCIIDNETGLITRRI